jgi:anti-anti-sigma factor
MDSTSAKLMVAVLDKTVCVRIHGRADFTCSVDLRKLICELQERGYSHFILDLRECRLMDSTFLGVLANITLRFAETGDKEQPLELLNANPRIIETLDNLGVAHLFKICSSSGTLPANFLPLSPGNPASPVEMARTCLQAHETLMTLNPENAQKFKDVAQFLAEDLHRLETGQRP